MTKSMKRTPCEVYSRVCGYLRPVNNWNDAKKSEFYDRKNYKVAEENENLQHLQKS